MKIKAGAGEEKQEKSEDRMQAENKRAACILRLKETVGFCGSFWYNQIENLKII